MPGRGGAAGLEPPETLLFRYGVRSRMMTFAEIDGMAREQFRFWVSERLYLAGNTKQAGEELRLYLAGIAKQVGADGVDAAAGVTNRLLTFADIDDWAKEAFAFWITGRPTRVSVFLDSGAFGAYTRGAVIDLGRYCRYIEEHQAALSCYAALDVIKDWRATARNLDVMEARGLRPVPTFHRGSPWEELERLASSHPYVALGGLVGGDGKRGSSFTEDALRPYLDRCWKVFERYWPIRVHVFGVTVQWVLERYPFYSADSASAIMGAGMGRVSVFERGRMASGRWQDYAWATADGVVVDGVGRTEGKSKSAHAGRRRRNVEAVLVFERYLTDLWAARGVVWEDGNILATEGT